MKQAGQVVIFRFPQTDLAAGKLRPALIVGKVPGVYDDWLMSMLSSRTEQATEGFDEVIRKDDPDFAQSGAKTESVIRLGRLAVVEGRMLIGAVGEIDTARLKRLRENLAR